MEHRILEKERWRIKKWKPGRKDRRKGENKKGRRGREARGGRETEVNKKSQI